ncbi:hypothetical protein D0T49_00030 [Paludibacter sp. 221]|uniref:hypothetical protein n=1 Tax=Paludibacter sp. 221 TaxID=2302939 RepID=UPI0013D337A5|nr:hypothetical protein [Paludibacter sp. 221]NDV45442.1 hypothetical protein [Paludibacter sp. 221]
MNEKILTRITSIIAVVLLAVSIILVGIMYLGPSAGAIETAGGDTYNVPVATDTLIYWCYALLIATAAVAIGFAIYKFVKNIIVNPKSGIKTIATLAVFALIFIVAWNVGSPEKMSIFGYEGNQNEGFWAQFTDMIIYACYTLFAIVILAIVGSRIYVKLK